MLKEKALRTLLKNSSHCNKQDVGKQKEGRSAEYVDESVCVGGLLNLHSIVKNGHCQSHTLGPCAMWNALENDRHLRRLSLACYVSREVKELAMLLP